MIRYFAKHPTAANLLMIFIIFMGIIGLLSLNRQVFPEFDSDFVHVKVVYKGAAAEDVEETICQRIEEELDGIEGIKRIQSTAQEGFGLVEIEVTDGYDVGTVLDDVENAVEQIDNFPEETEDPIIWHFDPKDPVITLSLYGDVNEKDLLALAEQIKDELLQLDDVHLVDLTGFPDHEIHIEVDFESLLSYGLSVDDVAQTITAHSVDLPAGSIETDEREIKIRVDDQRQWVNEYRDLTIFSDAKGAEIPLGSIAKISDTFEEEWDRYEFKGEPAVSLTIKKTEEGDFLNISRAVREFVALRQASLPPGINMEAWNDFSILVRDRLSMLVKNGIQGFILVFFTLWLFLNVRLSIWVAVGIPISFFGALYLMYAVGLTLDMITMFSLILALGIIVDDAIVISENIWSHRCKGKSALQSVIDGTVEVLPGVISSVMTTIAVFLPLMMMKGEIGKVLRVMPIGVVAALIVSLIEGFLILPNHLNHTLHRIAERPHPIRRRIDDTVKWIIDHFYIPLITWVLNHRSIPIAATLSLFFISISLIAGGRINFQPFPDLDGDMLVVRLLLPQGTDFDRTRTIVDRVQGALDEVNAHFKPMQPQQQDLIEHYDVTYGANSQADVRGSHVATITVELLTSEERNARCDDILALWRDTVGDIPDVISLTYDQLQITPGGKAFDIELQGHHLDQLKDAGLELQKHLNSYKGVINLFDNLRPGKEEISVKLKPSAHALGISSSLLSRQLRAAFWGATAQEFQRGENNLEVDVILQPSDRNQFSDLGNFKIIAPNGSQIPFYQVAEAQRTRGYAKIVRVNGRRTINITGDIQSQEANAAKIMQELQNSYFDEFLKRHPGVNLNLEGQSKETAETMSSVLTGFIIGVVAIFIILSFVFQSYIEPLIVMLAIPLGIIGAILGHFVMGIVWCMPSTVGFVSLAGIVVNDSILLVEFIKIRLSEGHPIKEAIIEAGRSRFRPVFLTTITTIAGLLPLILEQNLQAQVVIPVAVSIAFGLMFATILILVLIPCLYSVLSTWGVAGKEKEEM